jgi:tetratricopeptide (TPR) repeat protein
MPRGSLVFALMLAASSLAQAQPDKRAQALQLADESERAYKAGQFEKSAELLRKAHATYPEPLLLYNLGRALEGMGDTKGAVEAYDQYLKDAKHIDDRPAIERRVATLKAQLDRAHDDEAKAQVEKERQERERVEKERLEKERQEHEATDKEQADRLAREQAEKERLAKQLQDQQHQQQQSQPPPPPPPLVENDRTALEQYGPWVTMGAGGALIGLGGLAGWRSGVNHDNAVLEKVQLYAAQDQSSAQTYATIANVMFVVGGAAVIGGGIWEYFEWRNGKRESVTGARLKVAPNGLAVEWKLW